MSYSLGANTLKVSAKLFAENRSRLVAALKEKVVPGSVVLLQGGTEKNRYNTDAEDLPFRQESYFFWTFGVHESDFFGVIDVDTGKSCLFPPTLDPSYAIWDGNVVLLQGGTEKNRYNTDAEDLPFRQESYFFWTFGVHESDFFGVIDVDSGKSCLFPPTLDPSYAIWDGKINNEDYFKSRYEVDEVHFNKEKVIADYLRKHNAKSVLLLRAENSDSGNVLEPATFEGKEEFNIDTKMLYPVMADLRVFKTDRELQVR
ncbi:unnamed protein product [Strongylus vulgaris]|uniref:Aminopeptidase P N-terminal domain-containing protein n=1 Tax=Strongylus vulgaris TaxID=40348 RepID=A0A3P7K5B0_STRVU|nr:unnamed protein product [Strongylus vulgaris]